MQFTNEKDAIRYAERYGHQHWKCPHCGFWHIGKQTPQQTNSDIDDFVEQPKMNLEEMETALKAAGYLVVEPKWAKHWKLCVDTYAQLRKGIDELNKEIN